MQYRFQIIKVRDVEPILWGLSFGSFTENNLKKDI